MCIKRIILLFILILWNIICSLYDIMHGVESCVLPLYSLDYFYREALYISKRQHFDFDLKLWLFWYFIMLYNLFFVHFALLFVDLYWGKQCCHCLICFSEILCLHKCVICYLVCCSGVCIFKHFVVFILIFLPDEGRKGQNVVCPLLLLLL